jgi:mannose-6-phosphate isomerase-like protein (cupin superfamily)
VVRLGAADAVGFSLVEYEVPAGFSPPPRLHRHTREDAVAYVLHGQLHYWFADGDAVVLPGDVVHLPRGAWFRWANDSEQTARMLCMFAPAGFEQFFVDVLREASDAGDLGRVIGPLRERYGDEDHPGPDHETAQRP